MQPVVSVVVTRAWHWGVALIGDLSNIDGYPDYDGSAQVAATESVLIIPVRHVQDTDDLDGFAECSIDVRDFVDVAPPSDDARQVLFEGRLAVPRHSLEIGDADGQVSLSLVGGDRTVIVSVPRGVAGPPSDIRVDLYSP